MRLDTAWQSASSVHDARPRSPVACPCSDRRRYSRAQTRRPDPCRYLPYRPGLGGFYASIWGFQASIWSTPVPRRFPPDPGASVSVVADATRHVIGHCGAMDVETTLELAQAHGISGSFDVPFAGNGHPFEGGCRFRDCRCSACRCTP